MKLPRKLGKRLYQEEIGEVEQIVYGFILFVRGCTFLLINIVVWMWDLGRTLIEEEEEGIRHWKKKKPKKKRKRKT